MSILYPLSSLSLLSSSPASMLLFLILSLLATTRAFSLPFQNRALSPTAPRCVSSTSHESSNTRSKSQIRGSSYSGNSTISSPTHAAHAVNVTPTWEASKSVWQTAWRVHSSLLPVLHHRSVDACEMKDSKLALAVLWWKALSGNDASSPVYDHQLSYDLLPPITRSIVHPLLSRFYPRLHHANVEIRTAYLDKAVSRIISSICNQHHSATTTTSTTKPINIRLIVMGGGYDTRSFKFIEHHLAHDDPTGMLLRKRRTRKRFVSRKPRPNPLDALPPTTQYKLQCYELDLPEVVNTKRKLIESRVSRRRPWLKKFIAGKTMHNPILMEVDLNNLNQTQSVLESILSSEDASSVNGGNDALTANIILFEGVMIYLDKGVPHSLLELCSNALKKQNANLSSESRINDNRSKLNYLCFADRLDHIPGGDEDLAKTEMDSTGWILEDWLSKPGLARHMGYACLK